jgi:HAD superfamily hydrolase (TIGR01509 family)
MQKVLSVNLIEALQGKSLLIFDFDGTVADTSQMHATAFSKVLEPLGITSDYSRIAGMKTLDAMHQCLSRADRTVNDTELAALVNAKQQCVRQMICQALQPLPGVDEFLKWARMRYRLAMVTSGSRGTVSLALEKLGYADWFDPLICADDVHQAKPDPAGFLAAIEMTAVSKKYALVFEDSDAGIAAAAAADLDYCDVRTGLLESWCVIEPLSRITVK